MPNIPLDKLTRSQIAHEIRRQRNTVRYMMGQARKAEHLSLDEWVCLNHARTHNYKIEELRQYGRKILR